ncbi:ABC transporter, ATP-binding protein, flagellar [Rhodovulum sp. P5]|uniref:FliH/SctL family protein n=1 Tax=Rhodovulum sp. P5 TaxID=1564506 RepID=UPI0009C2D241|nr:hypothetical protein [Rhodovulum sp. P5]ARE40417.1 ABC transporter, ATP-binding protein, flagellar [Rhodovulum sp. P5]
MSRLKFEDFSVPAPQKAAAVAAPAPDPQEERLNAYEEGYKAGWDDAIAAEAAAQTRISADFGKTLQEMTFSYNEARAHVMGALGPLLTAMVERVMPQIAADGFARTVVKTAMQMAESEADHPLSLRVCPENRMPLEDLVGKDPGLPLKIVEDDTLGPGQALISSTTRESEVDIDGMLLALRTGLEEFLTAEEEARRHG